MSIFSDIGGSIVTAITGVDQSQVQAQLTQAEQSITSAVEAIIVILAIIAIELAFVIRNTK
jgi:hypothetical protein